MLIKLLYLEWWFDNFHLIDWLFQLFCLLFLGYFTLFWLYLLQLDFMICSFKEINRLLFILISHFLRRPLNLLLHLIDLILQAIRLLLDLIDRFVFQSATSLAIVQATKLVMHQLFLTILLSINVKTRLVLEVGINQ